jgi:hypothetical protein
MTDEEKRNYEALKAHGHSPAKAAEIVLDAQRGDTHALMWIQVALASCRAARDDG